MEPTRLASCSLSNSYCDPHAYPRRHHEGEAETSSEEIVGSDWSRYSPVERAKLVLQHRIGHDSWIIRERRTGGWKWSVFEALVVLGVLGLAVSVFALFAFTRAPAPISYLMQSFQTEPMSSSVMFSPSSRRLLTSQSAVAGFSLQIQQSVPRWDTSLQPVPARFDPTQSKYLLSIAMWFVIPLLVAILTSFYGIIFCCCRCCCCSCCANCCGGHQPTEGCGCCPSSKRLTDKTWYTTCQRLSPGFVILIFLCAVVAFASLGYVGNDDLKRATDEFTQTLLDTADSLLKTMDQMISNIRRLDASISVSDLNNARTTIVDLRVQVVNIQKDIDQYGGYRIIAMQAALAFCIFIILLGFLGFLFGQGWLSMILGSVGFFVIFLCWLMVAIHFSVSLVISDLCVEIDVFLANTSQPADSDTRKALNQVLNCDKTVSGFSSIRDKANTGLESVVTTLNNQLTDISLRVTSKNYTSLVDSLLALNASTSNQAVRNKIAEVLPLARSGVKNITEFFNIVNDTLNLIDCTPINNAFRRIRNSFCSIALQGFDLLWESFFLIAISYYISLSMGIIGFKRFPSKEKWLKAMGQVPSESGKFSVGGGGGGLGVPANRPMAGPMMKQAPISYANQPQAGGFNTMNYAVPANPIGKPDSVVAQQAPNPAAFASRNGMGTQKF